jgi:hypothetical protein
VSPMTESSQPKFDNPNLVVEHPELHHYTTAQGLAGILASNTIWATHFSDLNDSSEVKLLHAPLKQAVAARCEALVIEHQRKSLNFISKVQELGGPQKVAQDLAQSFIDSLYQVTFDTDVEKRFGAPFIASVLLSCGRSILRARAWPLEPMARLRSRWRILPCI